ncbi:MAG: BrnT family toxin [Xanthobacteraceae bacterium]
MEKDIFAHVRTFEWDNDKRRANLRDHGIDFEDARVVIDGPTIVRRSDRKGELRYMVFGYVEGRRNGRRLHVTGRKLPDHLGAKSQTR